MIGILSRLKALWRTGMLVLATAALAASSPVEHWFVIAISDTPVGYIHESTVRVKTPAGERFVTDSDMKMVLNRLGSKVEMQFRTQAEENPDGRLLKVVYEMRASQMSTRTEAVVKSDVLEFRSETGGKVYSRTIPYSGVLLGQEGIRLLSRDKLKGPGDVVEFQLFTPELEVVSRGRRTVLAAETLRLGGKAIPTLKVEEIIEAAGAKSLAWLNSEFEAVKQEMPTPFGLGVFLMADKDQALKATGGGELPAELYERSVIRANVRLPVARELSYLKVKLLHKNPDLGWPEIKDAHQTLVSKDRATMVLEVRRTRPPAAVTFPVLETDRNREYLQPNATIQSDAAEVRSLAAGILAGETDLFKAALKLERWVAENMTFDLGIALAPSSELFQNRRGTCLGYATLLATLARAAGIPSRVVMGYVYVLGMFGGHAWTEVLAGDEWISVDAAIVAGGPADAARLALSASSLQGGAGSIGGGVGPQLFGQIDVKILAYAGRDGLKIAVPEDASPYWISDQRYENRWLGFAMTKPPEFRFTSLDAVWPNATVLMLAGPDGAKATLQQHFLLPWKPLDVAAAEIIGRLKIGERTEIGRNQGRPCFSAAGPARAALVIIDGPEAWSLLAEGKDAPALLDRIAAGWTFPPRQ